jgi:isoaspartyl peptidase/L-asparaginase-like protein (Ntn-hydrolase superfamily)
VRSIAIAASAVLLPLALVGCRSGGANGPAPMNAPHPASQAVPLPPTPWKPAAVAHGGVGSDPAHADGPRRAVDAALAALQATGDPLEAAVAGAVILEDDPRFNAGTGSIVRLDGSIQMDASVMDSGGRFGAVAGLEKVQNPVKVARAVLDTPHLMLMGDGATRFARALGFGEYDPTTADRQAATEKIKARLKARAPDLPEYWRGNEWRKRWNYELAPEALGLGPEQTGTDTVGVAVRAPDGRFGVALSTGGTAIMLRGRVGDVPIYGAGLYAGQHGAAAATGTGERIIEVLLAHTVHGWLAAGMPAPEAAQRGVDLIKDKAPTGLIVIGPGTLGAAASRPMAWAGREAGGPWTGPAPAARPGTP